MANESNLHPVLTHYIAWVKAHEKLLVIVLGAWLAFHFYGSALNAWVDHDKRNATIAQQNAATAAAKIEVDATANKQLAQQLADLKVQFATVQAQAQASIRQREQNTNAQKQKNDEGTSGEVAARTIQLLRLQPQDVTASPVDGTLVFTSSAAHTNVNALEDGQTAKNDLLDTETQLLSCTAVVAKDSEVITGLNKQIVDDATALSTEKISHHDDVAAEKANSQKQFRRGFKWGYIAGVGTAIAVKIAKIF